MVICRTNIALGKYIYPYVCEVKIESTWKTLTDTATISLPKKSVHKQSGMSAQSLISIGDEVVVKIGYDDRITQRFSGYVTSIVPGMPMEFKCEDKMWQLKRRSVANKSWRAGVKVADVLQYIGFKPNEYELIGNGSIDIEGDFTLRDCANAAQALMRLKEALPIAFFFRNGKLIVGDPYKIKKPNKVYLVFGYNIIDHALEFKKAEDVKIRIEAISKSDKGKDVKVIVGDQDGETHTYHVGMNLNEAQVRKVAEANLSLFKWSGWRGTLTLFGEPVINHGDIAVLIDHTGEIEGSYWVDKVEITSGTGGIRQLVTIGRKYQ